MAATDPRPLAACCALVLTSLPGLLAAEDQLGAALSVYADDDRATIVSPRASAELDVSDRVSLRAGWDADVITAATVDVRTSATPRGFEEVRNGATLSATASLDRLTKLSGALRGSTENDFDLVGASIEATRETRGRALAVTAAYGLEHALVGRAGDPTFSEDLWSQRATASAALVLDRRTVGSLSYTLGIVTGYQASPYRFVPVYSAGAGQGRPPVWIAERLPTVRERHAVAVEIRRVLAPGTFLAGRIGGYADGWGILAGTGQAEIERTTGSGRLALRARVRGYVQSGARFHEERYLTYPEVPIWASGDRELGAMWTLLAGVGAQVRIARGAAGDLHLAAGADILDMHALEFAPQDRRSALLLTIGATGRR